MKVMKAKKYDKYLTQKEGENLIISVGDGKEFCVLNQMARFIFERCDGKSAEEMAKIVYDECVNKDELNMTTIIHDCANVFESLAEKGLILYK